MELDIGFSRGGASFFFPELSNFDIYKQSKSDRFLPQADESNNTGYSIDYSIEGFPSHLDQKVKEKENEVLEKADKYSEILDIDLEQISVTDLPKENIAFYDLYHVRFGMLPIDIGGMYNPEMNPRGIFLDKEWVAEDGEKLDRSLKEELIHSWQYKKAEELGLNKAEWATLNDLIEGQVGYWLGDSLQGNQIHPGLKDLYSNVIEGEIDTYNYLDSQVNPFYYNHVDYEKIRQYLKETHQELEEKTEEMTEIETDYEPEIEQDYSPGISDDWVTIPIE